MTARPTPSGAMNDEPHRGHHAMAHGNEPHVLSPGLLPQLVQQTVTNSQSLASAALKMVAQVNSPAYLTTLGRSLLAAGNYALARQNLLRATQLDPQAADAWQGLGEACRHLGLDDEAIDAWNTALHLRPDAHEIHAQLGAVYRRRGNFEQAKSHWFQVAQLRVDAPARHGTRPVDAPSSPWLPLAELHWDQGKASEALEYYDRAFTGRVCDAKAEYLRGLIALAREQWQEGWRRFEYRRVLRPHLPQAGWPQPIWDGDCQNLADHRIIVHSEGKLADDILFAAWLPELIRRSGGTIIKCAPPLVQLFARSFPQAIVTAAGSPSLHLPDAHWQTALGSLPRHLGVDAVVSVNGPAASPLTSSVPVLSAKDDGSIFTRIDGSHSNDYRGYLVADWKLRRQWQRRVEHLGPGRKIGLAGWQSLGHDAGELLGQLWGAAKAQWLLLDRTENTITKATLPEHAHRLRALPRRKDLDDWAALLSSLDLVITPPGLTAHLAGALGVPVWVLTPAMAPWCWGVQGERSRWYPTARLFRQEAVGQWRDVIARMAGELAG